MIKLILFILLNFGIYGNNNFKNNYINSNNINKQTKLITKTEKWWKKIQPITKNDIVNFFLKEKKCFLLETVSRIIWNKLSLKAKKIKNIKEKFTNYQIGRAFPLVINERLNFKLLKFLKLLDFSVQYIFDSTDDHGFFYLKNNKKISINLQNENFWEPEGMVTLLTISKDNNNSDNNYFFMNYEGMVMNRIKNFLFLLKNNQNFFKINEETFHRWSYNFISLLPSSDSSSADALIGITFLSLILNYPLPSDFTITGTLEKNGNIIEIRDLDLKLIAADNFGFVTVFIPKTNKNDFHNWINSNDYQIKTIKRIILVDNFFEIYEYIFKNIYSQKLKDSTYFFNYEIK